MNLLPDTRKHILARVYLLRLAVVTALVFSAVLVVHVVLSVPAFVHVSAQVRENAITLEGLTAQLAGSQAQQVSDRVTALTERATYLAQSARQGTASSALRTMAGVSHPGIRLTSLSYAQATGSGTAKMTLTGIATSREALRAYVHTLSALPYVAQASLPISAYAKEADIEFSLQLTGTFAP